MILVYDDEGVGQFCLKCLLDKLQILGKEFKLVDADFIIDKDISSARAVIIPGGADLPYCDKLSTKGTDKIRDFVKNGGFYLGICAGAYFAGREIEFTGDGYAVEGARELALFGGRSVGSVFEFAGGYYNDKAKNVIDISYKGETQGVYYHGGGYFEGASKNQILAYYPLIDEPCIVADTYGKGRYCLSGVHFEIDYDLYSKYTEDSLKTQISNKLQNSFQDLIWRDILEYL